MAFWLFKEEPTHYNYSQLETDGEALWNGVTNNLALKHLRQVKADDRVFYYHTGDEKAIVGEMKVIKGAFPDPESDDPKLVAVKVSPIRQLPQPVTLKQIKADSHFKDWALVKNARLSVMPVPEPIWNRILALAGAEK